MHAHTPRISDLPGVWRDNLSHVLTRAILVLLVLSLYIASTFYNIRNEHQLILGDIERITRATTQSALLHTQAIFDATIHTLQALRADIDQIAEERNVQSLLDDHFFGSPYLRTTIVLDETGKNIASNFRELVGTAGSGYQFFEVHRNSATTDAFTGDVIVGRISRSAHFLSSIALRDELGGFMGVVAAAYELAYFQELYSQLAPDLQYDVALYHEAEGLVVAGDSVVTKGSLPSSSRYPLHLPSYESSFRSVHIPGQSGKQVLAFSLPLGGSKFHIATFADTSMLLANHLQSNRMKFLLTGLFVITVLALMIVVELHSARRYLSEKENTKLEQDLRQAQKLEALGTLAGGFAHDFNNLLSSIIGFAEVARERLRSGQVVDAALHQVLLAGRRAEAMVERILAFSERSESKAVPFELVPIVSESLELARIGVPTTTRIELHAESDCSWMSGDPGQIHQLSTNLCMNAVHAMPDGGKLDIDVSRVHLNELEAGALGLDHAGSYLKFTVSDTGVGIAPDVRERMFDPFYTTKAHGKGSGLGLSIVHSIVEEHRGAIEVTSTVGEGTEFVVWLPAIDRPENVTAPEDVIARIDGEGRIAVFVDDEEAIVELAEERLASFGFEPQAFTDSRDALRHIEENPDNVSLLITDYAMPNLSGLELASRARAIRPDVPIILITGFSTKELIISAGEIGNCEVVRKPLRAKRLAHAISQCLPPVSKAGGSAASG